MRYLHKIFNLYFKFFYVKKYIEGACITNIFLKKLLLITKPDLDG